MKIYNPFSGAVYDSRSDRRGFAGTPGRPVAIIAGKAHLTLADAGRNDRSIHSEFLDTHHGMSSAAAAMPRFSNLKSQISNYPALALALAVGFVLGVIICNL